jgi:hypothetical protein
LFFLPLFTPKSIDLEVTCRCRGVVAGESGASVVPLLVNGSRVANLSVGGTWRRQRISAPAQLFHEGINTIELTWPVPPQVTEPRQAEMLWERGEVPDLRPVFGELFTLQVVS